MKKSDHHHDRWLARERKQQEKKSMPKPNVTFSPQISIESEVRIESEVLDFSMSQLRQMMNGAVFEIAGPGEVTAPATREKGVQWEDIVGQEEAKAAVREAIESATKNRELYLKYGRKPTKGVLLYGPPGNGKTMIGKAAAESLAAQREASGSRVNANDPDAFIYLKGPEVFDMYLGGTEKKIRDLFLRAKRFKARSGYPAVIFIDEAEAIFGHRGPRNESKYSVPTFLAEMDGLTDSSAFVLVATNRPGDLDSAVVREGRVDRKILVPRPTQADAKTIIEKALAKRPVFGDVAEIAEAASAELFDGGHVLYTCHLEDGGVRKVTLGTLTSGAQVAAIVEGATTFAIEREIAGGGEGIRVEDFLATIARTLKEQRDLEHPTELEAFVDGLPVVRIERTRATAPKRESLIAKVPEGYEIELVKPAGGPVPVA